MPGRSCQRTCPLWRAPLVLGRGGNRCGGPSCEARVWLVGERGTRWPPGGTRRTRRRTGGLTSFLRTPGWLGGGGGCFARAFQETGDFPHFQVLFRRVQGLERRIQRGHPSRVRDPCMVLVRGRDHREERLQGVQQGRGAALEGGSRLGARQLLRGPH